MLELESDPYSMFVFAMNAKQTRDKYAARLKRFLILSKYLVIILKNGKEVKVVVIVTTINGS
jgi:hypothetical protein